MTLTGGLAVCAGSRGPGNLLFDANRSRVPVLAIAGRSRAAWAAPGNYIPTFPEP